VPSIAITRPAGGIRPLDSMALPGGLLPIVIGSVSVEVVVLDNERGTTGLHLRG
jgi:hypothetical protein